MTRFREDLAHWVDVDHRMALKVLKLVEAILRDPFEGEGKPEPLKYLLPDTWSRRITLEHRLIYRILQGQIHFLEARYHYQG